MVIARLKRRVRVFRREVPIYKLVLKDPKTPPVGKVFLAVALGYSLKPFHLIPFYIPLISHFDDFVFLVSFLSIAGKLIPREIIDKHRKAVYESVGDPSYRWLRES